MRIWTVRFHHFLTSASVTLTLSFLLSLSLSVSASDHIDVIEAEHDILDLYAFTSPTDASKAVIILDVARESTSATRFSDDTTYHIDTRELSIDGKKFIPQPIRHNFSCRFQEPDEGAGHPQQGMCVLPSGHEVTVKVNDPQGAQGEGYRVFAGLRSDPFFMAAVEILKDFVKNSTAFKNPGTSDTNNQNVMSLVFEVDKAMLGQDALLGLYAYVEEECWCLTELLNLCHPRKDSVGRAESANMVIAVPFFDKGNRLKLLQGAFNRQDGFFPDPDTEEELISRFNANLKRWDMMDGEENWPFVNGNHPLSIMLNANYLVLDLSKPFNKSSFFEIEKSLVEGKPHQTAGGRWLGDDVVDTLMTYFISRDGKKFGDFVKQATKPPTNTFPYVAPPVDKPAD